MRHSTARIAMVLLIVLVPFAETRGMDSRLAGKVDPRILFVQRDPGRLVTAAAPMMAIERYSADSLVIPILMKTTASRLDLERVGVAVGSVHGDIVTGRVLLGDIERVAALPAVRYIEASYALHSLLDESVPECHGTDVHNAEPSFMGNGLIIGFLDTGIDPGHDDFENTDGDTRVMYIWDQWDNSGQHPAGFAYGREWTKQQIDGGQCTMDDPGAHGTHCAGIAAGDGSSSTSGYSGMAPQANIIMVSNLDEDLFTYGYSEPWHNSASTVGALDGLAYMRQCSQSEDLPLVVSWSQGVNMGPHDGSTLFEQGVDNFITANDVPVVVAAGNAQNDDLHARGVVAAASPLVVELTADSGNGTIPFEVWYALGDSFSIEIGVPGVPDQWGPLFGPDETSWPEYEASNGDTVAIYSTHDHPVSNKAYFLVTLTDRTAGLQGGQWRIRLSAANGLPEGGQADLWVERNRDCWWSTNVSNECNITMPGSAHEVITVGAYTTKTEWINVFGFPYSEGGVIGQVADFSSSGPTADGRQKPELSAPGQWICSTLSSGASASANQLHVDQDGVHVHMDGTSMATPHVAGAVALMLESDPDLGHMEIRERLIESARHDGFTGETWSSAYGFGKLDAFAAVWTTLETFVINNGAPSTTSLTVTLNHTATNGPTHWMASESSGFPGGQWQAYTYPQAPTWTIPTGGYGTKTVWLKVKNAAGESNSRSDQIEYVASGSPPTITYFNMNNGDYTTTSRIVTLNNTASNGPTQYRASENSDFSGASWLSYSPAPQFELSEGFQTKRVYLQLKNDSGQSGVVYDNINYIQGEGPTVTYFAINNGAATTEGRTVTLNNIADGGGGTLQSYVAAESLEDLADASGHAYSTAPYFTLSSGYGTKTVWFQVRSVQDMEVMVSDPVSDDIGYVPPANLSDVVINEFYAGNPEWIEIYNKSSSSISITGWYIRDYAGNQDTPLSGTIPGHGYFWWYPTEGISYRGDAIELYNSSSVLQDRVAWGQYGGCPPPPSGHPEGSACRAPNGADTNDDASDWTLDRSHTRGSANNAPAPALGSSLILNEIAINDRATEIFNPTGEAVNLAGWWVSDSYDVINEFTGGTVPAGGFLVASFSENYFAWYKVAVLFNPSGVRVDQFGWDNVDPSGTLQRIPDGAGPNNGYDWATSGGGVTLFDRPATWNQSNTPTVTVISPEATDAWEIGVQDTIRWSTTGGISSVGIDIQRDGGSWTSIEGSPTSNDGSHPWVVTTPACAACYIRIADTGGTATGQSGMFMIYESSLAVVSPTSSSDWEIGTYEEIQWSSSNTTGNVSIQVSHDNGGAWSTPSGGASTPDDGGFVWLVEGPASAQCLVRVTDADGYPVATSPVFTISNPPPDQIAPAAIANLTATLDMVEVVLTWSVPWDNVGVTGFRIYRHDSVQDPGNMVDELEGTGVLVWSTTQACGNPEVNFLYDVRGRDAAGNVGAPSNLGGEFDFWCYYLNPPPLYPDIDVLPDSLSFALFTDEIGEKTLQVWNVGNADLNVQSITDDATWLTDESPNSFSVSIGGCQDVTVTANASGLVEGEYSGMITIQSNDLDEGTVQIPVTLTLSPNDTLPVEGLIAYYPFNGNAADESGHGYDGTVHGATLTADRFGNANSAYSFDGSDDHIQITNSETMFGGNPLEWSYSLWFKADQTDNGPTMASDYDNGGGDGTYAIRLTFHDGMQGSVRTSGSGTNVVVPFTDTSSWHHAVIVVTRTESRIRLYVDGVLRQDANIPVGDFFDGGVLSIGRDTSSPADPGHFDGLLDDLRFYIGALTVGDVMALFNEGQPQEGLIAYYPFNGNAADESGHGYDGTVHGATLTADRFGNANSAYSFDGSDDHIQITNSETMFGGNPLEWSYSLWFKADQTGDGPTMTSDYDNGSGDGTYAIRLTFKEGLQASVRTSNSGTNATIPFTDTTGWHHAVVVVTRSESRIRHYLDGVLRQDLNIPAGDFFDGGVLSIGRDTSSPADPGHFDGLLDDLRFYTEGLGLDEISALYHEGGW